MRYQVQLSRAVREYLVLDVEAHDADHAAKLAKDRAKDNAAAFCDAVPGRMRVENVTKTNGGQNA